MRRYHDTLLSIARTFAQESRHCHIRSLDYLDRCDAVVMEALRARSLRKEFDSFRMAFGLTAERKRFLSHLSLAGRWLRIYHERVSRITAERVTRADLRSMAMKRLDYLHDVSGGRIDTRMLTRGLDDLLERITETPVPHALVHKDFSYANVLVTPDGRVGSVDCRHSYGAVYEDLAHIVVDGYAGRWQVSSYGLIYPQRFLAQCRRAILDGYGETSFLNGSLVDFYCSLAWLKKWIHVEKRKVRDESFAKRAAGSWMRPYLKNVLSRLQRHQRGG